MSFIKLIPRFTFSLLLSADVMFECPLISISLSLSKACPRPGCHRPMTWVRHSNRPMPYVWRCPSREHRGAKICARNGSMFAESNLPFTKILGLLHHWAVDTPRNRTANLLNMAEDNVMEWFARYVQVNFHWILWP